MRHWQLIIACAFVLLAATVAGWFFGGLAGIAHDIGAESQATVGLGPVFSVGESWGAVTGLIAGLVWCRVMIPRILSAPERSWTGPGALVGLLAGWLSTALLHAAPIVSGRSEELELIVGLGCGTVTGLALGAICGAWCRAAVPPRA